MSTIPLPRSQWRHINGNRYTVLCIANEFSERLAKYPPTVVYQGDNGRIWSRPVSDWARSMTADDTRGPAFSAPLVSQAEHAARAQIPQASGDAE